MKTIDAIAEAITAAIAGLWGGQKDKEARRFVMPSIFLHLAVKADGFQWSDLRFLLLVPVLCMGYGENSQLMQWLGNDTTVRAVYATLLTAPFWWRGWTRGVVAWCVLLLAFQVRAGSLGRVQNFDILIEDILRYGSLSMLVVFDLFDKKINKGG
jgi:hypothetical protein